MFYFRSIGVSVFTQVINSWAEENKGRCLCEPVSACNGWSYEMKDVEKYLYA